jgi:hypothetical protein
MASAQRGQRSCTVFVVMRERMLASRSPRIIDDPQHTPEVRADQAVR